MQLAVISAALKQCYKTGFVMGTFYMPDHLRFKINLLVWYYFILISLKKKIETLRHNIGAKVSICILRFQTPRLQQGLEYVKGKTKF